MATSFRTNSLTFVLKGAYRSTNDYNGLTSPFEHNWLLALTNGSGAGSVNFGYQDNLSISSSSSTTIDLNALTDAYGTAIAPTIIKCIAIRLYSSTDTAATISIGAAASNAWTAILADSTDIIKVRYQGWCVFACTDATGYAVSGSNKNLKIANNSSTQSVSVDFVLLGVK